MTYIKQGSQEWYELRRKHIGASDSASILGISPWKTRYQLWQEKLGLYETKENDAMRRGKALENEARDFFSSLLDEYFVDDVKTKGIFLASLDGINLDKTMAVEIKCPNLKRVEIFADTSEIPGYYYSQLQHQMYVYDLDSIWYGEYHPELKVNPIEVERNDDFLRNYIEKAEEFWKFVITGVPPEMSDKDCVIKEDIRWQTIAQELRICKSKLDQLIHEEEVLKEALINLAGDQNSKGSGVSVTKTKKIGSIKYNEIPELDGVDLEKYRKEESVYWTVRLEK